MWQAAKLSPIARLPRLDLTHIPMHMVQRGGNRCFPDDEDRQRRLKCEGYNSPQAEEPLAWVVARAVSVALLNVEAELAAVPAHWGRGGGQVG